MDKQTKSYDKIATRLSQILLKLNGGEALSIEELAIEFGVDKRTIQRDLRQRLEALPIKKEGGRYSLEDYALGQLEKGYCPLFPVPYSRGYYTSYWE